MSARLLASSVLSALLMVGSAAANPIVVQPSVIDANDVALYERFPNDNLSGGVANPLLQGFTSLLVVSDTSGSGDFQSLLEFDLADLAGVDPADLVSATVSLYAIDSTQFGFPTASPSTATPIDVTLFDAPTGFDQTTATWNNSPYTRTAGSNLPTTTAYDTTVIDGIDQWFDFD
ncbi:MAG: DNRLRE domain-containing protein, partial [Planctomycetota bacterium]